MVAIDESALLTSVWRRRQIVDDCDIKIARYRAALDAGADPVLVAGWITETSAIRATTLARIGIAASPPQRLNEDQIAAIVDGLGTLLGILRAADPRDKAEVYSRIGLRMTYAPGPETIKAEVVSDDLGRVLNVCPRLNTASKHTVIASREIGLRLPG